MSTIRATFTVGGVATDVTTAKLSSQDATYGVKRKDTGAVIVADGTAMTKVATGVYEYTFTDPANDLTYQWSAEFVYGGETYWVTGEKPGPTSTATRLITVAQAKTYLGVAASTDDTTIGLMIDSATAAMEKEAGRHILAYTRTEILSGNGTYSLWLSEPPESITTIHESSDQTWDSTTLIDSGDYLQDGSRVEYLNQIWSHARMNIRVVYQAGWASPPADLIQACKMQVAALYSEFQRVKRGLNGLSSQAVQGWSQAWLPVQPLTDAVAAICRRYRPARL